MTNLLTFLHAFLQPSRPGVALPAVVGILGSGASFCMVTREFYVTDALRKFIQVQEVREIETRHRTSGAGNW
ncbi:hypothetical protein ACGFMO_38000 [Streptomyces niveus]|uniref:hypothetical protein n=1 Tax=Streptomyces niveus TaxID=193462 RepID=UPI00370F83D6